MQNGPVDSAEVSSRTSRGLVLKVSGFFCLFFLILVCFLFILRKPPRTWSEQLPLNAFLKTRKRVAYAWSCVFTTPLCFCCPWKSPLLVNKANLCFFPAKYSCGEKRTSQCNTWCVNTTIGNGLREREHLSIAFRQVFSIFFVLDRCNPPASLRVVFCIASHSCPTFSWRLSAFHIGILTSWWLLSSEGQTCSVWTKVKWHGQSSGLCCFWDRDLAVLFRLAWTSWV